MREKELRLALICYGGISLAVYMHGITKEVWRLARASRAFHAREPENYGTEGVYRRLLEAMATEGGTELRVLVDILTGASAGGINAIFLAEAIAAGRSLDPLTDLWLDTADVDRLIDPEVSAVSRFAKAAAVPFAWALSRQRGGTVEQTVEAGHREEIRAKLANFVRARWFAPPFSGPGFTNLLLGALDAMAAGPPGPPLLPDYQPLDLFVTVTDFHGHPETLRLHSPPQAEEREHRVTLAFRKEAGEECHLADAAELAFAARATASFPGAFPPFRVGELDSALAARGRAWPGRDAFLARALPGHAALGDVDNAVMIDGSVLANAPFRPAIGALKSRPARREVDRRFVYIDPRPGRHSVRLGGGGSDPPGFFATIFGAHEFDPVKVDRISPEDATAIRSGGAAATLKGIQFNSFGAFFSRAYRENDYLWGRLHGADRLIDIVLSSLPETVALPAGLASGLKRDAFRAILAEERPRLSAVQPLFDSLEREIG